jgi:hypothetical protein
MTITNLVCGGIIGSRGNSNHKTKAAPPPQWREEKKSDQSGQMETDQPAQWV